MTRKDLINFVKDAGYKDIDTAVKEYLEIFKYRNIELKEIDHLDIINGQVRIYFNWFK